MTYIWYNDNDHSQTKTSKLHTLQGWEGGGNPSVSVLCDRGMARGFSHTRETRSYFTVCKYRTNQKDDDVILDQSNCRICGILGTVCDVGVQWYNDSFSRHPVSFVLPACAQRRMTWETINPMCRFNCLRGGSSIASWFCIRYWKCLERRPLSGGINLLTN